MITIGPRWLAPLAPAILVLLAVVGAACGGGDPEELEVPVRVEGEKLVPGTVQVKHRDMVTLTIESATGGTFHLHGYDIEQEVKAGEPADFYFVAEIEGRFPITFHELGEGGPGHTHGNIFQSGLLEPGDTFSFVIPEGMESMAVPFHSHLHPQVSGSLTVSHHDGATGSVDIEIKGMAVHPHETVVRPGTTIVWTNNDSVTQTVHSGLHESSGAGPGHRSAGHEGADDSEEEVEIGILEVRPR